MDVSGMLMDLCGTILDPALITPEAPDVLTLADLLSDQTVVVTKEAEDRALLETIWSQSIQSLKPKLLEWVLKGRPDGFPIISLTVTPPLQCSDGVVRSLPDYIGFCSGKTIEQHVSLLQAKLPDIRLSFANIGGAVCITALKV